jgi:tetratricopeptide (TPR) repeat protein
LEALEVQRDLSRKIVANVRAKIGGDSGKPSKRGTDSPEAYQAYLKGRYFWNRRTAENIVKALRLFQEAAAADTSYALAYIGIADCYEVLEQYAGVPASESLPQARAAAQRALEIDAASSEAHASMGYVDMLSWRFDDSAKEFRRSIELDPNYASAHLWYGTLLDVMDRREEAATETHRAQELDPLSPITGTLACNIDLLRGRTDLAVEECRKVLELDDRFARAHDVLGLAYIKRGQSREGLAELEKAVALSGRGSQELGFLGYGYGATGRRSDAEAVLGELRRRYDRRRSPGLFLAAVCLGLGDTNQAFAWLEKDFQAHSGLMIYVPHSPVFERLRNEPRYKDLLRRLGL